jgi:hypothetical protein
LDRRGGKQGDPAHSKISFRAVKEGEEINSQDPDQNQFLAIFRHFATKNQGYPDVQFKKASAIVILANGRLMAVGPAKIDYA